MAGIALTILLSTTACNHPWFAWMSPDKTPVTENQTHSTDSSTDALTQLSLGGANDQVRGRSPNTTGSDSFVLGVLFRVDRVLIPASTDVSKLEEFWRHVDELRMEPWLSSHMARNGFRIGVIEAADKASILETLTESGGKNEQIERLIYTGYPLTLDLGPITGRKTVFTHRSDGEMVGKTVDSGTKFLHIDYDVFLDPKIKIAMRISPEVYKESEQPHWQSQQGTIVYDKRFEGIRYPDIVGRIELGSGELLVVTPRDAWKKRFSLGATFLTSEGAQKSWSTILIIQPTLYRNEDAKRDRP